MVIEDYNILRWIRILRACYDRRRRLIEDHDRLLGVLARGRYLCNAKQRGRVQCERELCSLLTQVLLDILGTVVVVVDMILRVMRDKRKARKQEEQIRLMKREAEKRRVREKEKKRIEKRKKEQGRRTEGSMSRFSMIIFDMKDYGYFF